MTITNNVSFVRRQSGLLESILRHWEWWRWWWWDGNNDTILATLPNTYNDLNTLPIILKTTLGQSLVEFNVILSTLSTCLELLPLPSNHDLKVLYLYPYVFLIFSLKHWLMTDVTRTSAVAVKFLHRYFVFWAQQCFALPLLLFSCQMWCLLSAAVQQGKISK